MEKLAYFIGTMTYLLLWLIAVAGYLIAIIIASPFMLANKTWNFLKKDTTKNNPQ